MVHVRAATHKDRMAFDAVSEAKPPRTWSTLASTVSRCLIAEALDDAPVGLLEAQRAGDDIEVIMITTHPSVRRQGIASRLLNGLLERSRREAANRIILDVAEGNVAAQQLYAKFGFEEIARRRNYYKADGAGPPRDALLLAYSFASEHP